MRKGISFENALQHEVDKVWKKKKVVVVKKETETPANTSKTPTNTFKTPTNTSASVS